MPRRKKKVSQEQVINSIINDAVGKGIDAIVKHHPRFRENQDYILRHIDKKKLNEKVGEIYEDVNERNWSDDKKLEYIHKELTDYVATGSAFDEAGKEVILKRGLEEKAGKWWGVGARRKLEGEKYLDYTIEAFQDLYSLFKTGAYAEKMPEVADAVTTVHEMGFLDPAVDVLKHYNLIDKKRYSVLKNSIREKTEEGVRQTIGGIEKYAMYQKAAALIFMIVGAVLILNSLSGITGFVISESIGTSVSGILGLVFIIGGVLLFVNGREERKVKEGGLEKTARQTKIFKKGQAALNSRAMGTYKDLRKMANQMGYVIKNAKGHYEVYFSDSATPLRSFEGHPVTIPRHHEKSGTYFGVLKNLVNNNPYQH